MENNNIQTNVSYEFLEHSDAKDFFAPLDYALKNGVYIQQQSKPKGIFGFVRYNYPSLHQYYENFFDLYLSTEGQDSEQYYFIDFRKDENGRISRGNIPEINRKRLKEAHLIVGFLLVRICIIDPTSEYQQSIDTFVKRIFEDYDEYKTNLFRLFAKNNEDISIDADEKAIQQIIRSALSDFNDIGWVNLDKDSQVFEVMPSCKRLLTLYEEIIMNIEEIIKGNYDKTISPNI
ncbi:condensin complex protein MksE [Proteiniphilum sp. UBA5384]|uniref:condensin complex protein MksE n=1 Tax=Proteiniphilum sp. UBA5384 TaxID=1947279 RepID=UPI0025D616AE|nr:hypothetical protein [Proteiniphilum sp. UBA5384]